MDFKDQWDLETAMKILQNQTVDSKLWAEAVEWLLLFGPPEIVSLLLKASQQATDSCLPGLHSVNYTKDGQPCYDITEIAKSLGVSKEEAKDIIVKKEMLHNRRYFFDDSGSGTVH